MDRSPLIRQARRFSDRIAIIDTSGPSGYADLVLAAEQVAAGLLNGRPDLQETRVAFLVASGFAYPAVLWGAWRAGGIAVPLSPRYPEAELAYLVRDCGASVIVSDRESEALARALAEGAGARCVGVESLLTPGPSPPSRPGTNLPTGLPAGGEGGLRSFAGAIDREASSDQLPDLSHPSPAGPILTSSSSPGPAGEGPGVRSGTSSPQSDRRALILYTSGTTSRPKGVVTTHANIAAQVGSLVQAWELTAADRVLHVLPLHHIHGVINALSCPLSVGATVEMLPRFDAEVVWERFAATPVTVFTAVPTIYERLIAAWEAATPERQRELSAACRRVRLMMSGSAALPVRTLERWEAISGHRLLERYGMTEIGMGLANPLHGERRPGHVGVPLPDVEVRLVDEAGSEVPPGTSGEIQVCGPGVFHEYWGQPEATAAAFQDGWFRTGDVAVMEAGSARILGRTSLDILKTGGYKVSALEVEEALREHPAVAECAVVGLEDVEWGQRVAAAVVPREGRTLDLAELRAWAKARLAGYKIPTRLLLLPELPRNAMGKVSKPELARRFEDREGVGRG